MAPKHDMQQVIDEFLNSKKAILGADNHFEWVSGYSQYECKAKFPIILDGESQQHARFELTGFTNSTELKFRLALCFGAIICRLDYTDETHANILRLSEENLPSVVHGPHYHSWNINRRFFKGVKPLQKPAPKLENAEIFKMRGNFDSILRWFCAEVNIEPLSSAHLISLPSRDFLL